jgi:capsular exopolysaccharide synthesis family protein
VGALRNDPVMDNYTSSKYALEALRRDRVQLEQVGRTFRPDDVPVEALLAVGLVNSDPSAVTLKSSVGELMQLDQQIRVQRRTLTDRNPALVALLDQRRALTAQAIPQQFRELLGQVRAREGRLSGVVGQSSAELQRIPGRTTEGEALRRERDAAAALFGNLNARYSEAQLAEKSLTPDVRVLDMAVLPSEPTDNTAPRLIAFGLAAGLGLGLALAVLIDRVDRRFRYPQQATHGLGLQILGAVPVVDQTRPQSPERVAQIVEAFRAIRMNVRYACMPSPRVTLTVTSPSPHDGKSLIASNLALSFAEGGWRTVLVDGDLRRGQLNATFDLPSGPGLVEYLEGTSLLGEVVQPTAHDNLALVATGTKHRRGPELLGTPRMQQLVMALAAEYDAVIVDSPPLGAGTDAYQLGAATQNMALVLRRSCTDLKMAEAKLRALDVAPVQVIGAVLNEVESGSGLYQYFAYDPEYVLVESGDDRAGEGSAPEEDDAAAQLPAGR